MDTRGLSGQNANGMWWNRHAETTRIYQDFSWQDSKIENKASAMDWQILAVEHSDWQFRWSQWSQLIFTFSRSVHPFRGNHLRRDPRRLKQGPGTLWLPGWAWMDQVWVPKGNHPRLSNIDKMNINSGAGDVVSFFWTFAEIRHLLLKSQPERYQTIYHTIYHKIYPFSSIFWWKKALVVFNFYPLVNVHITMDNHHFSQVNQWYFFKISVPYFL
jgi:hypothetical protein